METINWGNFPSPDQKQENPIVKKEKGSSLVSFSKLEYQSLEIISSHLVTNSGVNWFINEFSHIHKNIQERLNLKYPILEIEKQPGIWFEVILTKDSIRFFLTVPKQDEIIKVISHTATTRSWKKATLKKVTEPIPSFPIEYSQGRILNLQYDSIIPIKVIPSHQQMPIDVLLNSKHYLNKNDVALLQIGMFPYGEGWKNTSSLRLEKLKQAKMVNSTQNMPTAQKAFQYSAWGVGIVLEEAINILGDFVIPGWQEERDIFHMFKKSVEPHALSQAEHKTREDAFKTTIRILVHSEDDRRRKAICRSLTNSFEVTNSPNNWIYQDFTEKDQVTKQFKKAVMRQPESRSPILGSSELANFIQIPDHKHQTEHQEELSIMSHHTDAIIPKEVFDPGIPFATYEDTDGMTKIVSFQTKDKNLLVLPRIIMGEQNTGKTSLAINLLVDAFFKGFGGAYFDAADGKAINRIISSIPPEKLSRVHILDFKNTEYPISLTLCEAFETGNADQVEDLIAEEIISYIELVGSFELSMTAKTWIELACKAVFRNPSATLGDVMQIMQDEEFCMACLENTDDLILKRQWILFYAKDKQERSNIYSQAFYRLHGIISKSLLRNIFLQRPKDGSSPVNFRKWMNDGDLVLIKVNETLQEHNVTAIVTFLLTKLNIAVISREDIDDEDARLPFFVVLDEPDHYIKGSERWRNMLTRYRKYRCGLIFLFHGWEQLREADADLPKIIRKAGPHYIVFQTDEGNLRELRFVYEPEFQIQQIAKGIPKNHAIIRLKLYDKDGGVTPAFMAKAIDIIERRYPQYHHDDILEKNALLFGRRKEDVIREIQETQMKLFESEMTNHEKGSEFSESKIRTKRHSQPKHPMGRGDIFDFD